MPFKSLAGGGHRMFAHDVGDKVNTPDGPGEVMSISLMAGPSQAKPYAVQIRTGPGHKPGTYRYEQRMYAEEELSRR